MPSMLPLALLTVVTEMALRTSSSERPLATSFAGSICTRIDGFCSPPMMTWDTPAIWLICCATLVSALSSTTVIGSRSEVADSSMIGESAGFTLRQVGGEGRFFGSWPEAALMAACTSFAAPSMLRSRSNWIVMLLEPSEEVEVSWETPGIWANCRSSGCATDEAIVSGTAARQRRRHRDRREVDLRQRSDREQRVGDDTDAEDPQHQQGRGDRIFDERC